MSKDTALSSTMNDITQGISGVNISDKGSICGSCNDSTTEICANCGKEGDSLKSCAGCKLVKL
jgi:predicted amidophosphoribosyltransferase